MRNTDFSYKDIMIAKNLIILFGGITIGIIIGLFLISWFSNKAVRDNELEDVTIMRIKNGSKVVYVFGGKNFFQTIHSVFLFICWELGIINKNSIYYQGSIMPKLIGFFIIIFGLLVTYLSLWWTFSVVHVDGHWY